MRRIVWIPALLALLATATEAWPQDDRLVAVETGLTTMQTEVETMAASMTTELSALQSRLDDIERSDGGTADPACGCDVVRTMIDERVAQVPDSGDALAAHIRDFREFTGDYARMVVELNRRIDLLERLVGQLRQ